MKIATCNINGINKRLGNLLAWLKEAETDVVCLQELKAVQKAFPENAISKAGYDAVWQGQRAWNGVAILSRIGEPIVNRTSLPGEPEDAQARYVEGAVAGVLIASIYAPNGNPQPGPKFDYKLAWLERLRKHATNLRRSAAPIVPARDFNVAPTDLDIYPMTSWVNDAFIKPESRATFRKLVGRSWTDALRHRQPDERIYTFWHYRRMRWERDANLRLDHLLLSPNLKDHLLDAGVDREVRGGEGQAIMRRHGLP